MPCGRRADMSPLLSQCNDRCSPPTCLPRRISEILDKLRPREHRSYDLPLHADAAAVDYPQRPETQQMGLLQILLNHGLHIAWRNGMEIERVGDGDTNRFVVHKQAPKIERPDQQKLTGPYAATART